jgi:hypothetical protein
MSHRTLRAHFRIHAGGMEEGFWFFVFVATMVILPFIAFYFCAPR